MKAYAAACRKVLRLETGLFRTRPISDLANPNCKRVREVDTLALVRKLEFQGMDSKQAQAITDSMMEFLNSKENGSVLYVSLSKMHKTEMQQKKTKVNISMDHHFLLLNHEIDEMRNDILKMLTDSRHKFNRGIHMVSAQLEATKCDLIKFYIGILASTSAVGLAVLCSKHHWF